MSKANAALQEFRASFPAFGEFDTLANLVLIVKYMNEAWGKDSNAAESSSSWEIAFLATKSSLIPIPDYQPPTTAAFRAKVGSMSGSDVREVYQRDPEFRRQWDQLAREDSGITGFRPPSRQRLRDQGEI